MAEKLDCVVVGAGVVGLAIGRSLALAGRDVVVLESEAQIGMHASSRNSEVIHAGLHYPEDSLKARLCVQGKEMLYAFCKEHSVDHLRLGKLIVAPNVDDFSRLTEIRTQAARNGVTDLQYLSTDEVREFEPELVCGGGLLSPSTGIVDSHELMMALQADIEANGGAVVLNSEVTNLKVEGKGLGFESGGEAFVCKTLVNSAGLWAQELVTNCRGSGVLWERRPAAISGPEAPPTGESCGSGVLWERRPAAISGPEAPPTGRIPTLHLAKGHYFAYQGKSPFNHLVYPLPSGGGLGIHATNDLSGAARFGPDVTWIDSIDYDFDESRKQDFVEAIKTYFPALDEKKLTPAYAGIRPKLVGPGGAFADFVIEGEIDHGTPGLVNLFGIESPGLTASLAIGEYVRDMLG